MSNHLISVHRIKNRLKRIALLMEAKKNGPVPRGSIRPEEVYVVPDVLVRDGYTSHYPR